MVYSDVDVTVSAIVGSAVAPPQVLGINPDFSPVVLPKWSIQTFALQVEDTDSASITYTITAGTGATNPLSGTYSNTALLNSGQAYIYFTYFSPSTKAGSSNITVTLNDGTAVVVKTISTYIY